MKTVIFALTLVICASAQTGLFTPSITGFTSNVDSATNSVLRSYVGQAFTLTFSGKNFKSSDKFAFVSETNCDSAAKGTSAVKPIGATGVTATRALGEWTAADAPSAATASLLSLCWYSTNSDNESGWKYYGSFTGLNYRVVKVDKLSNQRFWNLGAIASSVNVGPTNTVSGFNLYTGDKISYTPLSTSASKACGVLIESTDNTQAITSASPFTSATFGTQLRFITATFDKVVTMAICYKATGGTARLDTGFRVQVNTMSTKNAIYGVFPSILYVANGGIIVTTPKIRVAGWNIGTSDVFTLSTTSGCVGAGGNQAQVPVAAENPLGAPAADTATAPYNAYTISTTGFQFNAKFGPVPTTPTTAINLFICYYAAGAVASQNQAPAAATPTAAATWFGMATADQGRFKLQLTDKTNCDSTPIITVIANDWAIDEIVFPKGKATNVFVRGCLIDNDKVGIEVAATACSATPTTTLIADASWPMVSLTVASGAAQVKVCHTRGATFSFTPNYDFYDATVALTAGGASYDVPAANANAPKWFMAGWKFGVTGNSMLFTPAGVLATTQQWMLASPLLGAGLNTASGSPVTSDSCAFQQLPYALTSSNLVTVSGIRNDLPVSDQTGTDGRIGTSAILDTGSVLTHNLCVRLSVGTTKYSSWMLTTITIQQHPQFYFTPITAMTLTAGSTPPIYVAGVLSATDKVILVRGAVTTDATTFACTVATPASITAVAGSTGMGTITGTFSSTAGALSFNADGVHDICVVRGTDARAYLLTANAAASTVTTSATDHGTVASIGAYAGQTFTVSTSNLNMVAADSNTVKITNTDCSGAAVTATTAVLSYSSTWTVGENGIPVNTGKGNAGSPGWDSVTTATIAGSSTTNPYGAAGICKSSSAVGTSLGGTVRIAGLTGTCNKLTGASHIYAQGSVVALTALGCGHATVIPGEATGKAFKVPGFGSYYLSGAAPSGTSSYALFDAWNLLATDFGAFISKSFVPPAAAFTDGGSAILTSPTFTAPTATTVQTYAIGNIGFATNLFYDVTAAAPSTRVGVTGDTAAGGVYNFWVKVVGNNYYNTGFSLLVVRFRDRFPGSSVFSDGAATLYIDHGGLDVETGEAYGSTSANVCLDCAAATAGSPCAIPGNAPTYTGSIPKLTQAANGYGVVTVPAFGAANTLSNFCYRPAGQAPNAPFRNIFGAATFIFSTVAAVAPNAFVGTDSATKIHVLDGKSITLTLSQAVNGGATINDGYKPLLVDNTATDCATAVGTTTNLVKNTDAYRGSDTTITAPLLSATPAGVYAVCFTSKKTSPAATDYAKIATLTVNVKPIPIINSATGNAGFIRNVDTNIDQWIDLTVSVTTRLDAADSICFVPAGSAPLTSAAADASVNYKVNTYTPAGATAAISAYCAQPGLSGTANSVKMTGFSNSATNNIPAGVYDVYVNAGSGSLATSRSVPVKITGVVNVISPEIRPSVYVTTGASTDTRTIYFDATSAGSNVGISTGACPTTGTLSNVGNKGTYTFPTTGSAKICFQNKFDATAPATRLWLQLKQSLTVIANSVTAANLAVPFGTKIHANTPTPLNFPFATSIAQPADIFRVLTYAATSKTPAATCLNAVSADVEKDTTMVGEFSPADIGSTSSVHSGTTPLIINAQSSYYAASGQQELTVCWSQQSTKPSVFEPIPTNAVIRVVDVSSFVIGSISAQPLSNTMPRTVSADYATVIFFNGRWIDIDDFASFVRVSNTDCSRAHTYENAVVSSGAGAPAAVGDKYLTKGFFASYESGFFWGGLYNLCYFAKGTTTGYRLYNAATDAKLRVIDATVSPRFASANTPITYTLSITSNVGLATPETTFTNMDRASFTAGGSLDCATLAGTTGNLPVNLTASADGSSATFTANLTASGTTASAWDPCFDGVLSSGWNTATTPNAIGPAGNLANNKNGVKVTPTPTTAISPYHVIVWAVPRFLQVTPVTVPVGRPTDVALWGSLLSATGDSVNVTMDATCTNSTVPAAGSGLSANPAALGGNSVLVRGWVAATKGTWNICYKPAGQGASGTTQDASGLGAHGATITAVVVDSVTPTGAAAIGNTVITLNGVFNFQANVIGDKHYVGLIPRDISGAVRDCAGLNGTNVVEATQVGTTSTGITLSLSSTLTPTANTEYAFCVHFAGMAWSTPADSAKDYVLVNPVAVSYSVRGVTDVQPRSIVNGTAQTLRFFGAGIRDFDSVTLVPATGNGNAPVDCAAAAASAVQVQNRAVTSTWAANAAYRVCYGFNISGAITWTFAGGNATTIASQAFQLTRLVAPAAVAPATTINADAGISTRVVVQGTGLSGLDTARLVNITSLTAAGVTASVCDLTSTAGGTPYYRVLPDPTTPGNWWFDVPAGDAASGSSFGICYRSGSLPGTPAPTFIASTSSFTIAFATAPRVQGYGPQAIPARVASVNFVFFGMALVGTDGVSIAAGAPTATSCAAPVSTTVVAVSPTTIAGRSIANATLAIPGTNAAGVFTLCYHYKNQGAGVAQAFTILPSAAACTAGQRYLCAGGCQATPCAFVGGPSTGCNGNPSAVRCPASNICVRTLADCLAFADQLVSRGVLPAPAAGQIRCFDGSLASNVAFCAPVDAPPAGYARCEDGSFSAAGACLDAKGAKIVNTCATQTPKATFCPNSGGCAASADFCPPADGCPAGKLRCSDCSCRDVCTFTGGPQGLPFQCADGTWRANEGDCKCHRFLLRGNVRVLLGTSVRRRFVVRASAALTVTLPGPASAPNILVVDLPVNVGVTDNCQLIISSTADSQVDAATTGTSYIASPMPVLSFVSGNSSTTPCVLLPTANITVSFPTVEAIGSNATLTCALPWGGNFMGSNVTVGTLPAVAPATIPRCTLSGAAIMSTPIALATGAITPKAPPTGPAPSIVPSVAPVPSVPPTNSSTAPIPSGGASTAPAPSGTASPSVAVTASSAIIAFVVAVLALLI